MLILNNRSFRNCCKNVTMTLRGSISFEYNQTNYRERNAMWWEDHPEGNKTKGLYGATSTKKIEGKMKTALPFKKNGRHAKNKERKERLAAQKRNAAAAAAAAASAGSGAFCGAPNCPTQFFQPGSKCFGLGHSQQFIPWLPKECRKACFHARSPRLCRVLLR